VVVVVVASGDMTPANKCGCLNLKGRWNISSLRLLTDQNKKFILWRKKKKNSFISFMFLCSEDASYLNSSSERSSIFSPQLEGLWLLRIDNLHAFSLAEADHVTFVQPIRVDELI